MSYLPRFFRIAILAFLALGLVVMGSSAHEKALISTNHDEEVVTATSVDEEAVKANHTEEDVVAPASPDEEAVIFSSVGENLVENGAEELPPPAMSAPADSDGVIESGCYHNPPIIYRQSLRANKFYGWDPPVNAVLVVEHPGGCNCAVEVPVCLPACVEGEPVVCSRCTLSGRGVVTFQWSSGFHVKVVFRKVGDIVVTYMPLFQ